MASRRKSRILAVQALYYWEASDAINASEGHNSNSSKKNIYPRASLEELISFSWLEEYKLSVYKEKGIDAYAKLLITGTLENIIDIDKKIKEHLEHWDINRLNRVDLAVLRISAYSLMYRKEIAPSIVINEAVELCHEFGSSDSYKFINGVLDSIKKSLKGNTL